MDAGGLNLETTSEQRSAARSTRRTLILNVCAAVAVESTAGAVIAMLPYLARREFGAQNWGTAMITSAVSTFLLGSIFWDELFRRVSYRRYLLVLWATAFLPHGLIALTSDFWSLMFCHAVSAFGIAAIYPLKGALLRCLYPSEIRGRVTAVLNIAVVVGVGGLAYLIGHLLNQNGQSFRVFLPIASAMELLGIVLLIVLTLRMPRDAAPPAGVEGGAWRRLIAPIAVAARVLRGDARFAAFEVAFMTYGVAFMFCEVLQPVLLDEKLKLSYSEIATAGRVAWQVGMVIAALPAGWLLDRIGAPRLSAICFVMLVAYPLLLIRAESWTGVVIASSVFGIAMAGVNQGWMLGPIALAPAPDRVSQYVAIHASLTGVRGLPGQLLGMAIFSLTGSLVVPFLVAAGLFGWAAYRMSRVQRLPGPPAAA